MAIACLLEWEGVYTEHIEPLIDLLDLDKKLQSGSAVFGAGEDGGKMIVITVWETQAALDQFLESCLAQAVARAGLAAPYIRYWDVNGRTETSVQPLKLEWNDHFSLDFHGGFRKN